MARLGCRGRLKGLRHRQHREALGLRWELCAGQGGGG